MAEKFCHEDAEVVGAKNEDGYSINIIDITNQHADLHHVSGRYTNLSNRLFRNVPSVYMIYA